MKKIRKVRCKNRLQIDPRKICKKYILKSVIACYLKTNDLSCWLYWPMMARILNTLSPVYGARCIYYALTKYESIIENMVLNKTWTTIRSVIVWEWIGKLNDLIFSRTVFYLRTMLYCPELCVLSSLSRKSKQFACPLASKHTSEEWGEFDRAHHWGQKSIVFFYFRFSHISHCPLESTVGVDIGWEKRKN